MRIEPLDIPVAGGTLRALRFGGGDGSGGGDGDGVRRRGGGGGGDRDRDRLIVAAHGITASAMAFRSVARALPPGWSLVALDLRGRGGSAGLPGPYGMNSHADDICAAAEFLGAPIVLTGQSMGAYAALRAAARRPDLFTRLVLVDGGLPLPVPAEFDPDRLLEASVGPAVARLRQTFPSEQAYLEFFQAHPALRDEWSDDMVEYVRYDATGEPGAIRSRVNAEAVYADGRDLLVEAASFGADLEKLTVPAVLLYAPRGMLGQEPGMLPQPVVDHWSARAPGLRVESVPGTNHYTILMTDGPAATIVRELVAD